MSPPVAALTLLLFALPAGFAAATLLGVDVLLAPAIVIVLLYAWVWLRFRPDRFEIHNDGFDVVWPLKRRHIPRRSVSDVRIIDRQGLKGEIGWGIRIGAGGLWGGFGWVKTKRRGLVNLYVSRTDRFVWIERVHGRPWLITPENPEEFVQAFQAEA